MSIADDLKDKWNKKSNTSDSDTDSNPEWKEDLCKLLPELPKIPFKKRVEKLAGVFKELETSDLKFRRGPLGKAQATSTNHELNSDLKEFEKLNFMLYNFGDEVVAVTGKLANVIHKYMKTKGGKGTYHAAIGKPYDAGKIDQFDKVDLTNPKIYREMTYDTGVSVIVFCNYKSLWAFVRNTNLMRWHLNWYKSDEMDGILVYSFSKYHDRKDSNLAKADLKGQDDVLRDLFNSGKDKRSDLSFKEFKSLFVEEKESKNKKFDEFLFGKHIAKNTVDCLVGR